MTGDLSLHIFTFSSFRPSESVSTGVGRQCWPKRFVHVLIKSLSIVCFVHIGLYLLDVVLLFLLLYLMGEFLTLIDYLLLLIETCSSSHFGGLCWLLSLNSLLSVRFYNICDL